jgi:hypothetical protein
MTKTFPYTLLAGLLLIAWNDAIAEEHSPARVNARELPPPAIAIIENAERLQSGQYRCQGMLKATHRVMTPRHDRDHETTSEFDLSIEAEFDFDSDRISFRSKRARVDGPAQNMRTADQYRWYLNIPGLTVELRGTESFRTAILHPPTPWTELWPNQLAQRYPQPVYDPRLLGWAGWDWLGRSFEEFVDVSFLNRELRTFDEGSGIQRIESWTEAEGEIRYVLTLWVDETQGGQPVRSSYQWVDMKKPEEVGGNNLSTTYANSEQSWEKHNDVWVLKTLDLHFDQAGIYDLQLSFDWQNVNQPIPAERFDWKKSWKFGSDYHQVLDQRLGGRGFFITRHKPGRPYEVPLPRPLDAAKPSARRWPWLLAGNVAVISLFTGWLARRYVVKQ